MALRAIKSPSRFARHTGQSPTRNVYHISVRMLPGSSGGRPMLCRALAPTSSPGWAGASCAPLPRPSVVSWPLVAQVASGSRPLRLRLACCVRSRARPPPLLRSPGPSLGSLGPFRPSPGPGRPCVPPLSRSARVRAARSVGARWPRLPAAPPSSVLRAPCSVALASLGLGPCAARGPAGGRFGPASRLRARGLPALPPLRGLWPRFSFAGAGLLAARAGLPALAARLSRLLPWSLGSPCFPPAPAAPLGLPGSAWPPARVPLFAALSRLRRGLWAAPGAPYPARFTIQKL